MERDVKRDDKRPTKVGWRVREFALDTGLPRSSVYKMLQRGGPLEIVRLGNAVIITTSPAEFLDRLRAAAR